jgi:hypothetical protein
VDFFQFLREHFRGEANVSIAAEDADYKEVALHSDIVRLATLFVEWVAAPIAIHLVAAYLKDFLGSRLSGAEARAAITVHRKDGDVDQTVRISYEGPAQSVEQALLNAIGSLPKGPVEAPTVGAVAAPRQRKQPKKNQRRK